MNKKLIMFCAVIGGFIGGYIPVLFGDQNILDGWTILGSMIGGFLGIYVGVWVSKRYG